MGILNQLNTVKLHNSAPAFNIILPIAFTNFCFKKHFHSYLYIGNNDNHGIEYNFNQSLEMRGLTVYGVSTKKVLHKREEKMHEKMKMTSQRAENLVHV